MYRLIHTKEKKNIWMDGDGYRGKDTRPHTVIVRLIEASSIGLFPGPSCCSPRPFVVIQFKWWQKPLKGYHIR